MNALAVTDLLCTISEAYVLVYLYFSITYSEYSPKHFAYKIVIFTVVSTLVVMVCSNAIPFGYHTVTAIVINIAILCILDKRNSFITILKTSILIYIAFICIEIVLSSLAHFVNASYTAFAMYYLSLILKVSLIFLAQIFRDTYVHRDFISNISTIDSYILFSVFTLELGFLFVNYYFIPHLDNYFLMYELLLIVLFLGFVVIIFINFKKIIRLEKINSKYMLQEEHIKNLESLISIVRKEKHDFANHINTINAICLLNKPNSIERITNYLSTIAKDLKGNYKMCDTGNDYLDGLFAIKSNYAFENNITFDLCLEISMEYIKIRDTDLISIISNIVDNGIESMISDTRKDINKVLSVATYIEDDYFILSISNNGPEISNNLIQSIFKQGFSTKKHKKDDHGYGLYIVKSLVEGYGGSISVISNEHETEFILKFKLEDDLIEETCITSDRIY